MEIFGQATTGQVAFCMGFIPLSLLWFYSEILQYLEKSSSTIENADASYWNSATNEQEAVDSSSLLEGGGPTVASLTIRKASSPLVSSEFGFLLGYLFICDRTNLFGESKKSYSRDLFFFLYFVLIIVAAMTSFTAHHERSPFSVETTLYLNRHQTEEWKGWMQVLFVLYHYYDAKEIYNAIRIFIASYVWMTGFGNFSYYFVKKNFSISRFFQMMWRLNFFVALCCIVLDNHYMLYYICPMHTFFTLLVYSALGILNTYNEVGIVIAVKIAACFLVIILMFEVPDVFDVIWSPLEFLLGYVDPSSKSTVSPMHEWKFRSGLDRYIWIVGMIYAYYHPTVEKWIQKLEETGLKTRIAVKGSITVLCSIVGYLWYEYIYKLEKYTYNKYHPYTSWIPITIYICLRNITQGLRSSSLGIFVWLGKITLETYISQFHIWLRTGGPDEQPRKLLDIIPNYPMLNFLLTTVIYVTVSRRVFHLTNVLKAAFIPSGDGKQLAYNVVLASILIVAVYIFAWILLKFVNILG